MCSTTPSSRDNAAGVNRQNIRGLGQEGKPSTGNCIVMCVYVAPSTLVGAWPMAFVLQLCIECYILELLKCVQVKAIVRSSKTYMRYM